MIRASRCVLALQVFICVGWIMSIAGYFGPQADWMVGFPLGIIVCVVIDLLLGHEIQDRSRRNEQD